MSDAKKAPSDYDQLVGDKIRQHRNAAGMSQMDLASRVGVTFQQIQKYEKATNRVSASRLEKIADALGVKLVTLIGDEGAPDARSSLTTDAISVGKAFDLLDPVRRRAVMALVTVLGERTDAPKARLPRRSADSQD